MSFGFAPALFLLPVIPVAWALWLAGALRARRRVRRVSRTGATGPAVAAPVLLALATATAVIAAARPQWGEEDRFVPRRGADLVVVLDVSRSMGARDVEPSRLEAAKAAIVATFERLGGDRAGLVIFAGDAIVRAPLTGDLTAASRIVRTLEPGPVILDGGTSAASGLDLALSLFDPSSEAGRLVVLITDGDDLGRDPASIAARYGAADVDLLVLGAGTAAGATVPVFDGETVVDLIGTDGAPVVTRLNEPLLRTLAAAAGGQYLGNDLAVAPSVVASRMAGLSTAQFDERSATLPIERGHWFAGAAGVLALLATAAERLRRARRVSLLAAAVLGAAFMAACATRAYEANRAGIDAYTAGDFAAAANHFVEAQALEPDNPEISLNLAAALHAAGRFEEAAIAARRALASPSPRWRARAQASIGHHRFAAGDLVGALEAFKQALLENPSDDVSRRDYEVVLRLLTPPDAGTPAPQPGDPGASPTPGGGSDPGATPTPGAGPADPGEPGETGDPGESPGVSGLSEAEIEARLAQLDAEIETLLREAGEEPTAAEALEILRLLEEYTRIAGLRRPFGGPDPNDY